MTNQPFNIALIIGSVREKRKGIKVAHWLADLLHQRGYQVDFIDLKEKPLDMLDKRYKDYDGNAPPLLQELHGRLTRAKGFVFVTPEYNYSVPPALKNFLDHFGPEFSKKPAAIISYSTGGFGGIRAKNHLDNILSSLGLTVIPKSLPISQIDQVFNSDGVLIKTEYQERAENVIKEFEWYLEMFRQQNS